jgi:hypothetical protein
MIIDAHKQREKETSKGSRRDGWEKYLKPFPYSLYLLRLGDSPFNLLLV